MKSFVKNDQSFICENCSGEVPKLVYSSRDHCPRCLCSIHVDINPGDRENTCRGILRPIGVEMHSKKGIIIVYKCTKCGEIKRNRSAEDDDYNKILKLSAHEEL